MIKEAERSGWYEIQRGLGEVKEIHWKQVENKKPKWESEQLLKKLLKNK